MRTIVVGYVSKPEGRAALRKGIEEARLRDAQLLVVNSNRGGPQYDAEDSSATNEELGEVEDELAATGIAYEVRGLVRGESAADDVIAVAEEVAAEFIVIGLRKRTPVGKLILGSHAQKILLEARCPVLAVKADDGD